MFKQEITFNGKSLAETKIFPGAYVSGEQLGGLILGSPDKEPDAQIIFSDVGNGFVFVITVDNGFVYPDNIEIFQNARGWTMMDVYLMIIEDLFSDTLLTDWYPLYV